MSLMACSVSFFGRSAVGLANRLVDERFILEARTQDWPYGAEEAEVIVEGAALASTGTLSGLLTIRRPLTKRYRSHSGTDVEVTSGWEEQRYRFELKPCSSVRIEDSQGRVLAVVACGLPPGDSNPGELAAHLCT